MGDESDEAMRSTKRHRQNPKESLFRSKDNQASWLFFSQDIWGNIGALLEGT